MGGSGLSRKWEAKMQVQAPALHIAACLGVYAKQTVYAGTAVAPDIMCGQDIRGHAGAYYIWGESPLDTILALSRQHDN